MRRGLAAALLLPIPRFPAISRLPAILRILPEAIRVAMLAALTANALGSPAPPLKIGATPGAYLLYCGGCHGINGHSSDIAVPDLRGQVDSFLCLPAGRQYIIRLPNVAFAPLSDAQLADLMNFVVGLGNSRQGRSDPPYTAAEVGALRRNPLMGQPLTDYRRQLVTKLIEKCGAPRSLLTYGAALRTP